MPDGKHQEAEVSDYAYRLFRDMEGNDAPLPEYFVDAQCLSPNDHLEMQAALQDYVDSSISKTINILHSEGEGAERYCCSLQRECTG